MIKFMSLCVMTYTWQCMYMHLYVFIQSPEQDIGYLPLSLSAGLLWDRVFCWTRSLRFQICWSASELWESAYLCISVLRLQSLSPCLGFSLFFNVGSGDLNSGPRIFRANHIFRPNHSMDPRPWQEPIKPN